LIVVVVFFSIPQSKLVGYIFPAIPPLSFIVADSAMAVLDGSKWKKKLWWMCAGTGVAISMALVAGLTLHPVKSTKEIARVLKSQRTAQEPVIFLNGYYYDVPFYAGLGQPAYVVADWAGTDAKKDSWQKELLDAAKFDPKAASRTVLNLAGMHKLLCSAPTSWIIAPKSAILQHAFLAHAREQAGNKDVVLLRFDRNSPELAKALQCL